MIISDEIANGRLKLTPELDSFALRLDLMRELSDSSNVHLLEKKMLKGIEGAAYRISVWLYRKFNHLSKEQYEAELSLQILLYYLNKIKSYLNKLLSKDKEKKPIKDDEWMDILVYDSDNNPVYNICFNSEEILFFESVDHRFK